MGEIENTPYVSNDLTGRHEIWRHSIKPHLGAFPATGNDISLHRLSPRARPPPQLGPPSPSTLFLDAGRGDRFLEISDEKIIPVDDAARGAYIPSRSTSRCKLIVAAARDAVLASCVVAACTPLVSSVPLPSQ